MGIQEVGGYVDFSLEIIIAQGLNLDVLANVYGILGLELNEGNPAQGLVGGKRDCLGSAGAGLDLGVKITDGEPAQAAISL